MVWKRYATYHDLWASFSSIKHHFAIASRLAALSLSSSASHVNLSVVIGSPSRRLNENRHSVRPCDVFVSVVVDFAVEGSEDALKHD